MSQFLKRNMLLREVDTPNVGVTPEVQPGQNLQGILWSAYMQGGDVIRLGPYTYHIQKTITIPENVTLVGVPRLTKLVLQHTGDSTEYGPVVILSTKSRLIDCHVDMILATGFSFSSNGSSIRDAGGGTTDTGDATNNSVVALVGANARLEGCFIPGETSSTGKRRAVVVEASNCFVINNEIEFPNDSYGNACIYVDAGVNGTTVMGNWCESTTDGDILYASGTNHVIGATGVLNYAKVATY